MPDTENVVALSRLFGVSTDYLLALAKLYGVSAEELLRGTRDDA